MNRDSDIGTGGAYPWREQTDPRVPPTHQPALIIIIIIITRPKPAYGWQGLAGLWGQNTDQAGTFWDALNVSLCASRAQLEYELTWKTNLEPLITCKTDLEPKITMKDQPGTTNKHKN